jgi:hypothetical protein
MIAHPAVVSAHAPAVAVLAASVAATVAPAAVAADCNALEIFESAQTFA